MVFISQTEYISIKKQPQFIFIINFAFTIIKVQSLTNPAIMIRPRTKIPVFINNLIIVPPSVVPKQSVIEFRYLLYMFS